MAKRSVINVLTRILKRHSIDYEVIGDDDESAVVEFALDIRASTVDITATLAGPDLLVFFVEPAIEIPRARMPDVIAWTVEVNANQVSATFLPDLETNAIAIRHAVDSRAVPTPVLEEMLPLAWTLVAEVWLDYAPELFRVLAGVEAPGDDADETAAAEDEVEEGEEETVALTEEEQAMFEEAYQEIGGILKHAIAERFDDDLADALDGALYGLAEEFVHRAANAGENAGDDVDVRIKGTDDAAVLAVGTVGIRTLRFRFSPAKIRAQRQADQQGLTLFYNALPAATQQILTSGFVDERVSVHDYDADADGVPETETDEWVGDVVPLTSAPLGPDDRGARTAVIRLDWDADAPDLSEFAQTRSVYAEDEVWLMETPIRRWHVPAELLNETVRGALATVTLVSPA